MKALQFSGGKDSLACLYMHKDDPELVAVYADSGNPFPHVRDFVLRTARALGVSLVVASPDIPVKDWQDANGLPADILPVDASPLMRGITKEKYPASLVPYVACCSANLWQPMAKAIAEMGATTVIRGSKASDGKVGVPDGHVENGVTYLSPLWNWSDADVFAYLKGLKAELPPQYEQGADSLDCWSCTAYMNGHGQKRFAYLKANYPELYAQAKGRLDRVRDTVRQATEHYILEA